MKGLRVPLFAVGVVFLLVLAGMGVMTHGIDQDRLANDEGDALSLLSSKPTPSEQYELYLALSTFVPSDSSYRSSSREDRKSEANHRTETLLHRWLCPICDATKTSFGGASGRAGEEAANNLKSHVRNSGGHGHGPPGSLPTEITPDVIRSHILIFELPE